MPSIVLDSVTAQTKEIRDRVDRGEKSRKKMRTDGRTGVGAGWGRGVKEGPG